ncbi:MAG: lactate utilization protein B/C [Sphingobacteriales bacterium]|nr:MAG: lactate utilization protein B/C [Sphingobacteriales bacterium]
MSSRNKILNAVKLGKPALQPLPASHQLQAVLYEDAPAKFIETFSGIGGQVIAVNSLADVDSFIAGNFSATNIISNIPALKNVSFLNKNIDPHELENIELAILPAQFGVAENGALWMTENDMGIRALPFICQQLAVVLSKKDIVSNMQQAYDIIAETNYGFAAFVAGPSKTADIEQSLVLGAHGPKGMIIFLVE